MKLINIGFGNMVSANRLIAIVSPESAPIKRIVQEARDKGSLIDATYGRRTRAVIIMDSDHIILSAVQPETVLPPPVTLSVTPLPTMPPRYRPPESSHFAQQFSMAALQMPATPPT